MNKLGRRILISVMIVLIVLLLILSSLYIQNQYLKLPNTSSDNPLKATENYTWTQDKTMVTNGEVTLEVGSKITGYEANGVSDWYVLGAEGGRLLLTTNYNTEVVTLYRISSNVNGISTLNSAASAYKNTKLASTARAINVNDINRVTGYNVSVNAVDFGRNNFYWYGNSVTYKFGSYKDSAGNPANIQITGTKYPTSAKVYRTDYNRFYYPSSSTRLAYFSSGSKTFTSNLYRYYPQTLSTASSSETSINGSSLAYNLLFVNTSGSELNTSNKGYWLANTFTETVYGEIMWRTFWSKKWYGYRFSNWIF